MEPENKIYLINKNIKPELLDININLNKVYYIDFADYTQIQLILQKAPANTILIYDQTITTDPIGTTYSVNDHINRIGHNPFIGHQKEYCTNDRRSNQSSRTDHRSGNSTTISCPISYP